MSKRSKPAPSKPATSGRVAPSRAARAPIGRPRARTPRALAAVLDPEVVHAPEAPLVTREPRPAPSSKRAATAPRAFARRSFRERAASRDGRVDLLVFRVGHELFATDLSAVEEAVEQIDVQSIPDMPTAMLGVFALRDRMLAVYAPEPALRVPLDRTDAATIVIRTPFRRVGIAVDDIEDVVALDLTTLRAAPGTEDSDGVLLGVMWRGADLISVVDADALVASCVADTSLETA